MAYIKLSNQARPTLSLQSSSQLLYTMSVCCLVFFRVESKVVSLRVYREGDWLRLEGSRERYDSINTLVMLYATAAVPISIGDHTVLAFFQYPVYSSK